MLITLTKESSKGDVYQMKILSKSDLSDKVCVVVGTRPGIIKMGPIILSLRERNQDMLVLHTGQHYSYNMDRQFFADLKLPEPDYQIESADPGSFHGEQTAKMLVGAEEVFMKEKPRLVLVCGDANTNFAAAVAARKLQIEVGHVESGLRSGDWRMPEEHNRVMIDHISEYLFAPTKRAIRNLQADGVLGKIYLTGNTIVDAVMQNIKIATSSSNVIKSLGLEAEGYLLVTVHREENVDNNKNLLLLCKLLEAVCTETEKSVIFPCHPRTLTRFKQANLYKQITSLKNLCLLKPLGYLNFLLLLKNAHTVLTDSGGIQEESCILRVPCITLRESTERQETLEVGANRITGFSETKVLSALEKIDFSSRNWVNPYGDGKAADRIADVSQGKEPEPLNL